MNSYCGNGTVADYRVREMIKKFPLTYLSDYLLQPTKEQKEHRVKTISLLKEKLEKVGLKSYLYGSMALQTYLPIDGDLDLSVFCKIPSNLSPEKVGQGGINTWSPKKKSMVSYWTEKVNRALESEAEDLTFINAQVSLFKCRVNGISVDISGNQVGGLCTLCFLEECNRLLGKNNLFKRTIRILKAWSYYESRILASHHGLLSTYGLTVMILYIFNEHYDHLKDPEDVVKYFFQIFSKFDWDTQGISILGAFPIDQSKLPHDGKPVKVSVPELSHQPQHKLSKDFIKRCTELYGVQGKRMFVQKYLNIVDPVRKDNNLGRHVSRNNFLRIRKAIEKGARQFELYDKEDDKSDLLFKFYRNTFEKNIREHSCTCDDARSEKCSENGLCMSSSEGDDSEVSLESFQKQLKDAKSIVMSTHVSPKNHKKSKQRNPKKPGRSMKRKQQKEIQPQPLFQFQDCILQDSKRSKNKKLSSFKPKKKRKSKGHSNPKKPKNDDFMHSSLQLPRKNTQEQEKIMVEYRYIKNSPP